MLTSKNLYQAFLSLWRSDSVQSASVNHHLSYLRDLLYELVIRDMKLRYRRSLIGVGWSLLNPVLQLLVFSFIFQYILPLEVPNYTLFLFIGLLVWNWFQASLLGATTAIVDNGNLLKRPGFPAVLLPVVVICANLVHFLLAMPIVFLFLVIMGHEVSWMLLLLPAVVTLQFIFTLSLAYFLATFQVSLRDTQHLINVFLLLLFYLSPIFYDSHIIPAHFQTVYQLNPLVHLMNAYRAILLYGEAPALRPLLGVLILSTVLLWIGYRVFVQASYRFVEEL